MTGAKRRTANWYVERLRNVLPTSEFDQLKKYGLQKGDIVSGDTTANLLLRGLVAYSLEKGITLDALVDRIIRVQSSSFIVQG